MDTLGSSLDSFLSRYGPVQVLDGHGDVKRLSNEDPELLAVYAEAQKFLVNGTWMSRLDFRDTIEGVIRPFPVLAFAYLNIGIVAWGVWSYYQGRPIAVTALFAFCLLNASALVGWLQPWRKGWRRRFFLWWQYSSIAQRAPQVKISLPLGVTLLIANGVGVGAVGLFYLEGTRGIDLVFWTLFGFVGSNVFVVIAWALNRRRR